ncbi:hypothetical protein HK28_06555 [Acetobacter sp. DsW_063]|nr:hypothetical protein HK28_06555 [Acetobacter sp. DsW_063]
MFKFSQLIDDEPGRRALRQTAELVEAHFSIKKMKKENPLPPTAYYVQGSFERATWNRAPSLPFLHRLLTSVVGVILLYSI